MPFAEKESYKGLKRDEAEIGAALAYKTPEQREKEKLNTPISKAGREGKLSEFDSRISGDEMLDKREKAFRKYFEKMSE